MRWRVGEGLTPTNEEQHPGQTPNEKHKAVHSDEETKSLAGKQAHVSR